MDESLGRLIFSTLGSAAKAVTTASNKKKEVRARIGVLTKTKSPPEPREDKRIPKPGGLATCVELLSESSDKRATFSVKIPVNTQARPGKLVGERHCGHGVRQSRKWRIERFFVPAEVVFVA